MKKVYFACSIRGGRDNAHVYQDIVVYIKAAGANVLSEVFADQTIKANEGTKHHNLTEPEIWKWDLNWISEADAIIAEVSTPSLGVGYEIGKAEALGKPILALYHPSPERRLSSMIAGNPNVKVFEYADIMQTEVAIKKFLSNL